jgi:hypothetical protein
MSKQVTKADLIAELKAAKDREVLLMNGLNLIKRYVSSAKFHEDRNVNVSDILLRIEETKLEWFRATH